LTKHRSPLATLFALLANISALHAFFIFFCYARKPVSDLNGLLIWWGCLTLTYGVLILYLRRPRTLQRVMLIAAGGLFLQLLLTLLFAHRHTTFLSWFILLFMWICMYYRCCSHLLEGIKPETIVAAFETTTLMLFVSAFAVTLSVMAWETLICTAAGVLFSLVAMAQIRSGNARVSAQNLHRQKSRFLLIAVLLGIGGGVTLFCVLLANSASQVLTRFTQWALSVLRSITQAIGRFFRWLASLFPEQYVDPELLNSPTQQLPFGNAEWGTVDSELPLYLIMGGIALLVALALFLLWRGGGLHHLSFRSRTVSRMNLKRHRPQNPLRQLWRRISRWMIFRITYLRQRNTAPGLFVWLERQMQLRKLARKEDETARSFLIRAGQTLPRNAELLSQLADCLDCHYFGEGHVLSPAEIAAMRKAFRTELHTH